MEENAFPGIDYNRTTDPTKSAYSPGMSLRDWFAGQAMIGVLGSNYKTDTANNARYAYNIADAMLAERSK